MKIQAILLRILLFHVTFLITLIHCNLSTKERIELHKAWLARHGSGNKTPSFNDTTLNRITYLRKLIKFNKNTNEPVSANDVSYVPHNLSEEKDRKLRVNHTSDESTDNISSNSINNNRNDIYKVVSTDETPLQSKDATTTGDEDIQIVNKIDEITSTTAATTDIPVATTQLDNNIPNYDASTEPTAALETSTVENSIERAPEKSSEPDIIKAEDLSVKSVFTSWSNWTSCSRSCGGGVKSQSRKCVKRTYLNGKKVPGIKATPSNECIGIYKRYHICNDHNCTSDTNTDFRDEQCKSFNNKLFGGKKYRWEVYLKDDAECELNCKPIGMQYFATLNKTVIDGTECTKPSEYFRRRDNGKAICVEGICKAVHNSGVISGQFMNSGAVKCGSHICRPITGIFTKNPLPNGYVNVATIPAGASNISITELKNSVNFLVLKSADNRYIINGEYTVSLSGQYEAAGSTFDYRRIDGLTNSSGKAGERQVEGVTEWITCMGPTTEPIHLMVLSQVHNPGIKYEYLIPVQPTTVTTSEEDISGNELGSSEIEGNKNVKSGDSSTSRPVAVPKRRRFLWKVVGFSQCSKSCGGGTQTPIIKCVRESPQRIFNPKRCAHLKQPVLNESQMRCNSQPCPAYWKLSEWTECRCGEYNEEEYKSREVKCVQELMSGIVIQVKHGACIDDEPPTREKCVCEGKSSGKRTRPTIINRAHNDGTGRGKNRKVQEARKHGSWITAPWSSQCSSVCGMGVQYRSIFCERNSAPNSERCDLRLTPDTTRECSSNEKCAFGEWFTGPWSRCSGDCFNLTKGRSIVCIKDDGFAPDEDCNMEEKPKAEEICQMHEVDYCRPRWHYSEWSECSKKCGGGTQRRIVKCLEPNISEGQMKEANNCKYSERELAYKACNEHDCREATSTTTTEFYDPRVDMIQNDSNCVDDFPNCHLVVKAKLCDYKYYLDHCCSSCRLKADELY